MAILQSCCFWKTVRKGSFMSAFYTLIYFGFSVFILSIYLSDEKEFLTGAQEKPTGESILEKGDVTPTTVIFNILFLVCSILLVLASVLILIGLRSDKRELMLPWIVFMVCDVLIELAHLVYLSFTQRVIFDPVVGFLFTIDFFIMCLNSPLRIINAFYPQSYCLLCVISQYQNYRQGRGYDTTEIRADMMLDAPKAVRTSKYLKAYPPQSAHSPFITSNQHTNISAIPEEVEPKHEHRFNEADDFSSRENSIAVVNFLHTSDIPNQNIIPVIILDPNSTD